FVMRDAATGAAFGSTSLFDVDPNHKRGEIGHTWIGASHRRTAANTESKLLLLSLAFDAMELERVQLKTDARNARSRTAIARLGAVEEGILRRHVATQHGYVRDSAIYSIVREDWPAVRTHLGMLANAQQGVRLLPVSEIERRQFVERQIRDYAETKVLAGHWPAADAVDRSRKDIAPLLLDPEKRRAHRLFKAVDPPVGQVGWAWIGPEPLGDEYARWLYQLTVDEAFRRRGYGRAILSAVEPLARDEGATELRLNVFRHNNAARKLYESAKFEPVASDQASVEMRKKLA
ncbi:MAG TPA: GNAT family N-acetyltransferase, partial [Burkholderiales bacterium]|nr:GNAT family N-acetyltransferase [Burkholderiales bacterium]